VWNLAGDVQRLSLEPWQVVCGTRGRQLECHTKSAAVSQARAGVFGGNALQVGPPYPLHRCPRVCCCVDGGWNQDSYILRSTAFIGNWNVQGVLWGLPGAGWWVLAGSTYS
jgi:hypothetical protein